MFRRQNEKNAYRTFTIGMNNQLTDGALESHFSERDALSTRATYLETERFSWIKLVWPGKATG